MSGKKADRPAKDFNQEEYNDLELLDRLETLREDMEDLQVTSLAEVEQRIRELNDKLDKE